MQLGAGLPQSAARPGGTRNGNVENTGWVGPWPAALMSGRWAACILSTIDSSLGPELDRSGSWSVRGAHRAQRPGAHVSAAAAAGSSRLPCMRAGHGSGAYMMSAGDICNSSSAVSAEHSLSE